jgi:hypothetical protein
MKNFKLIGVLCIAVSASMFAIGVNETIYNGIEKSYFLFMFSLAGLFGFGLARNSLMKDEEVVKGKNGKTGNKPSANKVQKRK